LFSGSTGTHVLLTQKLFLCSFIKVSRDHSELIDTLIKPTSRYQRDTWTKSANVSSAHSVQVCKLYHWC